ncbi:MAG TPA: metal-sensitive transcriptional regulator [Ilumatobacteraceae bacterium]|nr:metal-sensitive transcriptional regulator [Ilumatobacteraceae bacterium]
MTSAACDQPGQHPGGHPGDNAERGYSMDKSAYLTRLKRIEGQVRGLQRMIDEDVYCIDVLTQVSAVTKALQSVAVGLLDQHVRHCVSHAITSDPDHADEKITEATRAIERLIKS